MPLSRIRYALVAVAVIAAIVAAAFLLATPRGPNVIRASAVVDSGADLKLEQAAAINVAPVVAQDNGPRPPGRLIIRSIGVNAPVLGVGVDKNGAMGVTTHSYDVGWYNRGPSPGDTGDAVIDGHLDWYDTAHAVFFNLKNLQKGDDIEVQRLDGVSHHFKVTSVQSVAYNAVVPGLFASSGAPRLSLITCGGVWSPSLNGYLQRVIVDSSMVS